MSKAEIQVDDTSGRVNFYKYVRGRLTLIGSLASSIFSGSSPAPVTVSDPLQGSYTPGSFTLSTGKYAVMANSLILTGTQEAKLLGTSNLRLC